MDVSYNGITKSLLVNFSPDEILLQEVIYRVATAYSIENGMQSVRLMEGVSDYKAMSKLSLYAGASTALSLIHRVMNRNDMIIQGAMNIFSMALTTSSVVEHIYTETKRKGMVDLEVLPALYMLKSFVIKRDISSVAIMWLATFGRHLIGKRKFVKEVKLYRVKDKNGKGYHYIANIADDKTIESLADLAYQAFFKKQGNVDISTVEKYITLSEK